jgi:hypothetical protein
MGGFKPNKYGIRGLDGNVIKWGISLIEDPSQRKGAIKYVVMPEAIPRQAWEAFEEAGVRTALTVPGNEKLKWEEK